MRKTDTKRVVTINDLSGLGRCSLTVSIPILSAMGLQACPVPTAVLTNQTGFPSFKSWEMENVFPSFLEEWKKREAVFDSIITGFFSNEKQMKDVETFISEFCKEDTLLLVDPVLGDNGSIYPVFDESFCKVMQSFCIKADVITPNITELCLLTDTDYSALVEKAVEEKEYFTSIFDVSKKLLSKGVKTVIVTGIPYKEFIVNLVCDEKGFRHYRSPRFEASYSGTGDIFASIVGGGLTRKMNVDNAVRLATSFLETAIRDTAADQIDRNEGLYFECHLDILTNVVNKEQSL